jgi:carbamoyl-phosphate synthase large subunit
VDCYVNKQGECIGAVPRLRIEVINGEVSKSRTVEIPELQRMSMKIVEKMGAVGPITLQWILNDDGMWCFEANHRFCGGSPLSIRAGFNTVNYVIMEYLLGDIIWGQALPWKQNIYMTRAFESVYYGD